MSWGRIDDCLWEHQKFEALRIAGDYRALSLWFLSISYCGKKQNPRVTAAEAQMLLCCSGEEAQNAVDSLIRVGLFDELTTDEANTKQGRSSPEVCFAFASKQNRSSLVHDWKQYQSKDEAKAAAGRKGGEKSGETRRSQNEAKSKQTRSKVEADAKQSRTPDPDPDPDPDTRSLSPEEPKTESDLDDNRELKLGDLEQLGFKRYGHLGGVNITKLGRLCPIFGHEWKAATTTNGNSWGYVAKVIESIRVEASKPSAPKARQKQKPYEAPYTGPTMEETLRRQAENKEMYDLIAADNERQRKIHAERRAEEERARKEAANASAA